MLITCVECGKQVSDKAAICPHCGLSRSDQTVPNKANTPTNGEQPTKESTTHKAHLPEAQQKPTASDGESSWYGRNIVSIIISIVIILVVGSMFREWRSSHKPQPPTIPVYKPLGGPDTPPQPSPVQKGIGGPGSPIQSVSLNTLLANMNALVDLASERDDLLKTTDIDSILSVSRLADASTRTIDATTLLAAQKSLVGLHEKATGLIKASTGLATGPRDSTILAAVQQHWDEQLVMFQSFVDIHGLFTSSLCKIDREEVVDTCNEARFKRGNAYVSCVESRERAHAAHRVFNPNAPNDKKTLKYDSIPLPVSAKQPSWADVESAQDGWFIKGNAREIGTAHGYHVGQNVMIEMAEAADPSTITPVRMEYIELVARYQPGVQEISRLFLAMSPDYNTKLEAGIRENIKGKQMPTSAEICGTIQNRNKYGYPQSVHRMLMAYQPEVCNSPVKELDWGWNQTINTDEFPKMQGHKPTLILPLSWKTEQGKNPHIAIVAGDARSQLFALIGVRPLAPADGLVSDEDVLLTLEKGIIPEAQANPPTLTYGFTKVTGHPAIWMLKTTQRTNAANVMHQRQLTIMAISRGTLYTMTFRADSVLSAENVIQRWDRYVPLVQRMLSHWVLD